MPAKRAPNKLPVVLIYVVLALATFVAFEPALKNDFVNYDDDKRVTENRHVTGGITRESLLWAFTKPHYSMWHPLTSLSHILDCELFGLNPSRHHLTSLLLHVGSALLLFGILKRMTRAIWLSGFVAGAFALHPLNVESVAWVAERMNVLSTLFWMLTIAAYIRYAERPAVGRFLLVVFVFALTIMTKAMVVTLPFALLLLDYWPLCRLQWGQQCQGQCRPPSESPGVGFQKASAWRLISEKIPLFILSGILSVITYIVQQRGKLMTEVIDLPLRFRISNALVSYIRYIGKMIYPSGLAALYPHPIDTLAVWQPIVSLVVLVIVSAVVVYVGRRKPYLVVGWLWYLGILVPVIGLVQVGEQAMADRYTYLPQIGIFIIFAFGAAEVSAKSLYRKVGLAITAGVVLTGLLICTRVQVSYWRNNYTLFGRALAVTKGNATMYNNYGRTLLAEQRINESAAYFHEALRIRPGYPAARANLGMVFLKQQRIQEAIACFDAVLRAGTDWAAVYNNLGLAYAFQGKYEPAIHNFREALRLEPNQPEVCANLKVALNKLNQQNEEIRKWQNVLETDRENCEAHFRIGLLVHKQGRHGEAIRHFTEILRLEPNSIDALNNLAWILATTQDPESRHPAEAVTFARRASELTNYGNPNLLDTLAIAYAAAGRFPESIATAEKAVKLAVSAGQPPLAAEVEYRLRLYRAGQAYREK